MRSNMGKVALLCSTLLFVACNNTGLNESRAIRLAKSEGVVPMCLMKYEHSSLSPEGDLNLDLHTNPGLAAAFLSREVPNKEILAAQELGLIELKEVPEGIQLIRTPVGEKYFTEIDGRGAYCFGEVRLKDMRTMKSYEDGQYTLTFNVETRLNSDVPITWQQNKYISGVQTVIVKLERRNDKWIVDSRKVVSNADI